MPDLTPQACSGQIRLQKDMQPGEPLWKRVPSRQEDGSPLTDFMMLIPRLKSRPEERIRTTLNEIQTVFDYYKNVVVFADLNLKLNVLWVSCKPVPGIILELSALIKARVPEALLVANKAEAMLASKMQR